MEETLVTIEETLKHPSYGDATFNLIPTRSGVVSVAEGRGGPLNISWELHGEGPIRVVFIAGLGSIKNFWQRQTLHFGHERFSDFSVLIFDNRGMGNSDKPLMRYSTSEMALDLLELMEHVGWVERQQEQPEQSEQSETAAPPPPLAFAAASKRAVHVVSLSMGGMIAQELACMAPDIVASLSLCCTAAAIENTSSVWENLKARALLIIPKSLEQSVRNTARNIFSPTWVLEPDNVHLPERGTHLVGPPGAPAAASGKGDVKNADAAREQELGTGTGTSDENHWYGMFGSNYQRFVAQELHKRLDPSFTTKGFFMQLIACGWHHKSPQQLAAMADKIGRERILIMHGTADNMISVPHGHKLIAAIQPKTSFIVEGLGHAPMFERWEWYHEVLEKHIQAGEKQAGR